MDPSTLDDDVGVNDEGVDLQSVSVVDREQQGSIQSETFNWDMLDELSQQLVEDEALPTSGDRSRTTPGGASGSSTDIAITDHRGVQLRLATSLSPQVPRHFWETNPFLRTIFGNDNIVNNLFNIDMQTQSRPFPADLAC